MLKVKNQYLSCLASPPLCGCSGASPASSARRPPLPGRSALLPSAGHRELTLPPAFALPLPGILFPPVFTWITPSFLLQLAVTSSRRPSLVSHSKGAALSPSTSPPINSLQKTYCILPFAYFLFLIHSFSIHLSPLGYLSLTNPNISKVQTSSCQIVGT